MISFEDTLKLTVYFGGMLGIILLAYYSRTSEEETIQNTPPSTSPVINLTPDEAPTETSANSNPAVVYRGMISQLGSEPDGSEENPYPTGYSVNQDDGTTLHYEIEEETKKEQ